MKAQHKTHIVNWTAPSNVRFGAAGYHKWICTCGRCGPKQLRESSAHRGARKHVVHHSRAGKP